MSIFTLLSWQIFFAGLWAQLWSLSWPVIAIVLLLAAAIFSTSIPIIGPWLTGIRTWLFVAAAFIAAYLVGEVHGINVSDAKWKARSDIVKKKVDDTVKTTPLDDPKWNDPNNSPDN